jgi:hypothetical protein
MGMSTIKTYSHVLKSPPLDPVLSQLHQFQTLIIYRHTSEILQVRLQITVIKRISQFLKIRQQWSLQVSRIDWLFLPHGHCKVTNWPNFNSVVSQGTGWPEERERHGRRAGRWSSQNTRHLWIKFAVLYGRCSWHPKTVTIITSMFTDHHNKHNNNNENLKYSENYQNVTRDMKWAHAVEKMAPIDLLDPGLPQTFNL